ncbi:MAG: hypothetical protein NZL93_02820, partial [Chthoniobacterales bacterium]|nr:hypothetical protein [Chthoniobacterales bacterium]
MKTTKKFWINGSYLNQSALFLGGVLLIILLIAAYSSHYIVQPEEQAVVKRFGKVIAIRDPGLYFK